MKRLLLLLNLSFFAFTATAQCPGGDIGFTSAADVTSFFQSFPNCSVIPGNLQLSNVNELNPFTDLSGLSRITAISGSLTIYNLGVSNLSGLSNLQSVGVNLTIRDNKSLSNLSGLNSLHTIGYNLVVTDNTLLNSFSGAPNLRNLGGLSLYRSPAITSITGLENITSLNGGSYIHNSLLTNLSGLSQLTSIGGLDLMANLSLTDISALNNITSRTPGHSFWIRDNPLLSNCAINIICNTNLRSTNISNNAAGCNSLAEVETACETPLPVSLISFAATGEAGLVNLKWSTTSETNSKQFDILHSKEGKNWVTIGNVASHIESITAENYQFIDKAPSIGNNYYRLKMVDQDNSFAYSSIAHAYLNGMIKPEVYPNPATKVVYIDSRNISLVELLDRSGKTLLTKDNIKEKIVYPIDIERIKEGLYILKITDKSGLIQSKKLIIE